MVFFIIKKYFKIGTPLYMSPEMLQHQEYDYNSDVWSLCMVFYEMIHGYCFWTAENP
jgi:serine/threonine protein kinase